MEKSYVSMGQGVCIVCGKVFDDGTILLDRRLKNSMDRYTVTGWGMCPEDKKKKKAGYVALVGVKNQGDGQKMKPEEADRTGVIAHLRKEAFEELFKCEAPPKMVAFVDEEILARLEKLAKGGDNGENK